MKKNNQSKKYSRKYLPWISTLGIIVIGAPTITLLVIIYSKGGDKPTPELLYDDPGKPTAYQMVAGTDFRQSIDSTPFLSEIKVPEGKTEIKFAGGFPKNTNSPLGFYSTVPNTVFSNLKYLEFGSEWMNVVDWDYSDWNEPTMYGSGFNYDRPTCLYKNQNIDLLIFRDCRPKNLYDVATHSTNFSYGNDGALDGNNAYFFDFPVNTMSTKFFNGEDKKPFTINPKTIYVRDGSGTKEQWMAKLNVTDKSIFKIVKKKLVDII